MNSKEKISLIAHSCAAIGVIQTLKALGRYALRLDIDDRNFDKKFNTNTAARILNEDLEMPDPGAQRSATFYLTAPERFIRFLIANLGIDFQEYDFVDIGCGKGRVLLIASSYPFRSIRGVELSKTAYAVAEKNLRIYKSAEQECFDVKLYSIDARNFEPRIANTVYYFYEPFSYRVLLAVLEKIASRLKGQGKAIKIVCVWGNLTPALPLIEKLGFEMTRNQKMLMNVLNYAVFSLRQN